jgi:hypothetical protein
MPRDGVDIAAQEYRKAQTYSNGSLLAVPDWLRLAHAFFAVFVNANTCPRRRRNEQMAPEIPVKLTAE